MRRILALISLMGAVVFGQVPVGAQISNIALSSYQDGSGTTFVDSSNRVSTAVAGGYQLAITKTAGATIVAPGESMTYTITVTNTGNISPGKFTVSDTVSTDLEIVSSTPVADRFGNIITWNESGISPSETKVYTLVVQPKANLASQTVVSNQAWLTATDGFVTASDPVDVTVGELSDMSIRKSVAEDMAAIGDTIHYEIVVTNTGNVPSLTTVVTDELPDHVRYTGSTPHGSHSSGTVTWNFTNIAAGDSVVLELNAVVEASMPINTELVNTAQVVNGNIIRSSSATTMANPWIQTIEKWAADLEYGFEDTVEFIITINNESPEPVHAITVQDTLPAPLQFVSASHNAVHNDGVVTWNLGTLNSANVIELTVVTTVGSLLEARPEITNRAWISTANAGTSYGDHVVSLAAFPELTLVKQAAGNVTAGDSLVYTFLMSNSGNSMAHEVVLEDTLPDYVSFGSATGNYVYESASHKVTWNVGEIAVGATDTLKLTTHVDYPVIDGTSFQNTAYLSSVEGTNSQSSVTTVIQSSPGLSLEILGNRDAVAGDSIEYELKYANRGTEIATAVVLTDTLPAEVLYLSAIPAHSYDPLTHVVTWNLNDLAPGDSGKVIVNTQVDDNQRTPKTATSTGLLVCEQGDQTLAQHDLFIRAPVLDIELIGDTTYIVAGEYISYDIAFQNVGDTTATNVVVVDSLPREAEFLNASGNGVYDAETHSVTWFIGDLDPVTQPTDGADVTNTLGDKAGNAEGPVRLQIDVRVIRPLPNGTNLLNRAYISSDEQVIAQATWLAIVQSAPDFRFTKIADVEVFPGETINYTLEYVNNGTDLATGVSIVDTLDSRVTFESATGSHLYDPLAHTVSWEIGSVASGDSGSFQITTTVDLDLENGARVGNIAWLTSNELEAIPAEAATYNILPLTMNLEASPKQILGNGSQTSTLGAYVYSYLGNPAPDGIDVYFFTDIGSIPDTVHTSKTKDGIAYSTLVADTVLDVSVIATPLARALWTPTDYTEDTTEVLFLIGAFDGTIANNQGVPQEDIRVELRKRATDEYAGHDSTDANGYYLIPFYETGEYVIVYSLTDEFGNPVETTQDVVIETPTEGSLVTNLNSVSGWIYDDATGDILREDSILVILRGTPDTTGNGLAKYVDFVDGDYTDSTYTDSTGKYFFTNLLPTEYQVGVEYNGVMSYGDATINVNLTEPGLYVVGANVMLRSLPFYMFKTVDKMEAAVHDTLHYTIHFGLQPPLTTYPDTVFIHDILPAGLDLVAGSIRKDDLTVEKQLAKSANELILMRPMIDTGDTLRVEFDAIVTDMLGPGWIENIAVMTNDGGDSLLSLRHPSSNARTKIIYPDLKIEKKSNRRVIERGDVITYTLTISNVSSDDVYHDFVIEDLLPAGFKYRNNTSYLKGNKVSDPVIAEGGNKQLAMTWSFANDTLRAGESFEIKYRIIAGLNSKEGVNTNIALAHARTTRGFGVTTVDPGRADVILKPGLFSDNGLIIGKVYFDTNGNMIHDNNEETVKDVELIMENGAWIRTDEFGKYSVPSVSSGMHVIRVNERTLPELSEIINDSPDYMGDTQSKMVRVPAGGIAKANFALRRQAVPGTITGQVYYDMNENGVLDSTESVESGIMVSLNDTIVVKTDSLGRFVFSNTPLGVVDLRLDESSLPSYARLFPVDSTLDSTGASNNLWNAILTSGDSVTVNIPLKKMELFAVVSKQSLLEMKTEMLTEEFRLLVYKPWTMNIRAGFATGSATLQQTILNELRNVGDLMKWQTQINLDINGHTDNVPLGGGGEFADNFELSEARANAIRDYLVETVGIDANRIVATGHADTLPLVGNDTPEGRALNRRVEMVFFNAETEDSEFNQLEFMYDIDYTGEIPLQDIRLHHELPPGFIYKEGTATIDSIQTEPVYHEEEKDIWELGDWKSEKHTKFDIAMKPDDYEKVQNTGTVTAHLEMLDVDGNVVVTDSLETKISTLIETLSFNMVLEGTQFASGSADLRPSATPSLDKLGKFLAWQPDIEVVIEGFTDDRGSLEYNMLLSEWRAISVKNYLLANFDVNPDNIHIHGLGPHYPVGDNETWTGRAANRRVEVLVNAEVGEAALLELDMVKESLKQTFEIPIDPMKMMSPDSALSIPADQSSTINLNLSFPAFKDATTVTIELVIPEDMSYVETAGTQMNITENVEPGVTTVSTPVRIHAGAGVVGRRELKMNVQLLEYDEPISTIIERTVVVNIEEPERSNE